MKKNNIMFVFFGILLTLSSVSPVLALGLNVPEGITLTSIPLADFPDDIYAHTDLADPWNGTISFSHEEIDFLSIKLVIDGALNITFAATPAIGTTGYLYLFYISSDGDDSTYEYLIGCTSTTVYLVNIGSDMYWNGAVWVGSITNTSFQIAGNSLLILGITTALPNIGSYKMAGRSLISTGPTYYSDRIVAPGTDIPGFGWLLLYFSFLTIIGLFYFLRKRRTSF